jgi:hypothetical protein
VNWGCIAATCINWPPGWDSACGRADEFICHVQAGELSLFSHICLTNTYVVKRMPRTAPIIVATRNVNRLSRSNFCIGPRLQGPSAPCKPLSKAP